MSIYTFSEAELRSRFIKNIGNRDDIDVYIEVPVFCRSVDLVIQEKENALSAYTTENKKTHIPAIKKSVTKYLEKMPAALADKILKLHQKPEPELIAQNLDALVECVYAFQTEFVNTFIVQKEYDKYLKFANMGPRPKLVIKLFSFLYSISFRHFVRFCS